MQLLVASAYLLLVIWIFIVGGCSQEPAQKTTGSKATPPVQETPGQQKKASRGEELFKQYCSPCHPDGGNVSDPQRTLRGSVLRKNNIAKSEAIINIMRHPISRMIRFDKTTIPDKDAQAIAEYVLKNFE